MMSPRRWLPAFAALWALTLGLLTSTSDAQLAAPSSPGTAEALSTPASDPGIESQFVSRINSLRASKGLRQLQVSGELVGVARNWTDHMVGQGQISHNPNLGSQVGGDWTKLGENVGVGYDVDGLMRAFINSPAHYANLVDPAWTHVGVGVSHASDGRIYTTHNFMALSGGGGPPPTSPPPPPSGGGGPPPTNPPSTPTTATAPPTTTTTAPPPPPEPHPTTARVTAVLDPLRSLESS